MERSRRTEANATKAASTQGKSRSGNIIQSPGSLTLARLPFRKMGQGGAIPQGDFVKTTIFGYTLEIYITRAYLAETLLRLSRGQPGESHKIKLIKALREFSNYEIGLSEAKSKVEAMFDFSTGKPVIK